MTSRVISKSSRKLPELKLILSPGAGIKFFVSMPLPDLVVFLLKAFRDTDITYDHRRHIHFRREYCLSQMHGSAMHLQ